MEARILKAIDVSMESQKTYVTLETLVLAGLIAYAGSLGAETPWYVYLNIAAVFVSAVLSVITLQSLINKLRDGQTTDPLGKSDVRWLGIISQLLFGAGVVAGGCIVLLSPPSTPTKLPQNSCVVTDAQVVVPSGIDCNFNVEREDGRVKHVEVKPLSSR